MGRAFIIVSMRRPAKTLDSVTAGRISGDSSRLGIFTIHETLSQGENTRSQPAVL